MTEIFWQMAGNVLASLLIVWLICLWADGQL